MRTVSFVLIVLLCATIPAAAGERISLFNGKDLTGWSHYLWDNDAKKQDTTTPMSAVWSAKDGILYCKGNPAGYIRTDKEYENYKFEVEWRWEPGTEGGNNGVLVHTTDPEALNKWPRSIEVQLFKENAGDFWVIGTELDVENEAERVKGRRHMNLTDDSENPIGEWNKMVIEARGDELKVWVNGDLVNHGTNLSQSKGAISLQSEGAAIQYRNIYLTPLD